MKKIIDVHRGTIRYESECCGCGSPNAENCLSRDLGIDICDRCAEIYENIFLSQAKIVEYERKSVKGNGKENKN